MRTASSAEGAAEGHTTRMVKTGESLTVNFLPASGFALSSVESSCGGSLQGNAFTVNQVTSDCLIEPVFDASVTPGDTLRVSLEEPVSRDTYSGIGNLRGWAVATVGVDRVEIWIDGAYAFDAPYGGERGDVGGVFPDINDSVNSGFSTAWNYNLMDLGEHTITARAYNTNGQYAESSKTFLVTRFHKPYLGADDKVDLSGAQCSVSDSQISLGDAKRYDIDGDVDYNFAKFINHSCNPNCEVDIIDNEIWISSIKRIKKGAELFYNYGYPFDTDFVDHICKCGSRNCVGYILSDNDWPKLKKYEKKLKSKSK